MVQYRRGRLLATLARVTGTIGWVGVLDCAKEVMSALRRCGCEADVKRHLVDPKGSITY